MKLTLKLVNLVNKFKLVDWLRNFPVSKNNFYDIN